LDNDPRPGSSDFWTLDLSAKYRLPMRYGLLAVGATNLTDRNFDYYDSDFKNPVIQPKRMAYLRFTLAFP
jgi:outer membrane receptor protein involved in Fe transport